MIRLRERKGCEFISLRVMQVLMGNPPCSFLIGTQWQQGLCCCVTKNTNLSLSNCQAGGGYRDHTTSCCWYRHANPAALLLLGKTTQHFLASHLEHKRWTFKGMSKTVLRCLTADPKPLFKNYPRHIKKLESQRMWLHYLWWMYSHKKNNVADMAIYVTI